MNEINKLLFIRVDGNSKMGLGHIVRTFALAQILKEHYTIQFYCKEIPDKLENEIVEKGFIVHKIYNEDLFFRQIQPNQIVVIDGYDFDIEYQKKVKDKRAKLVCIDDLHQTEFVADLIINHTLGVKPQDFNAKPNTLFSLGPKYALLRPTFLEHARKNRIEKKVGTLLIAFGGADPNNLTEKALKAALRFNELLKIIVITGAAFKKTKNFENIVTSDSRIDHRHSLSEREMFDAMLESWLALVPASSVLYEVIAVGTMPIIGYFVENQKKLHDYLYTNLGLQSFSVKGFDEELSIAEVLSVSINNEIDTSRLEKIRSSIAQSRLNHIKKFKILNDGDS